MKKTLFIVAALCAFSFTSNAALWRVNNIAGVNANFSTLTAAVTAASPNDTIYVEPSPTQYAGPTVNKKLTIIGNGYFPTTGVYAFNAGLQANMISSVISDVTFNQGSEGSTVMGCYITNSIYINASNISVKRNYVASYVYLSNYQNFVYVNISNIDIRQNIIGTGILPYQFATTGGVSMTNVNIQNNIMSLYYYSQFQLPVGISGFIMNNLLSLQYYTMDVYNFQINNNIMITGNFYPNNNVFFNNVAVGNAVWGNANGNQQNITTTALFTNYGTGAADSSFILNPAGPGIGTGFGGVNVGPYGGPDPYRKSGVPPVPTIYSLSAPATTTTSTLPVTISTRSND